MTQEEDAYRLLVRGRALMSEGLNRQAALDLERASQMEPGKHSIRETLARALFNSGQIRRAGEEFEVLVEASPTDHYAHFGLALCKARLGDVAGAIVLLKIALAMKPDVPEYSDALERLAP